MYICMILIYFYNRHLQEAECIWYYKGYQTEYMAWACAASKVPKSILFGSVQRKRKVGRAILMWLDEVETCQEISSDECSHGHIKVAANCGAHKNTVDRFCWVRRIHTILSITMNYGSGLSQIAIDEVWINKMCWNTLTYKTNLAAFLWATFWCLKK